MTHVRKCGPMTYIKGPAKFHIRDRITDKHGFAGCVIEVTECLGTWMYAIAFERTRESEHPCEFWTINGTQHGYVYEDSATAA
jgi:hypothetical protein